MSIIAIVTNANINKELKINIAILLIDKLMIKPITQIIKPIKQMFSIKCSIMFFFIG